MNRFIFIYIFQKQNSVELVDRRHIDSYMRNSITKRNSFIFVTLNTLEGETIATNFLLLNKIKTSENIINPNLQVSFLDICGPSISKGTNEMFKNRAWKFNFKLR